MSPYMIKYFDTSILKFLVCMISLFVLLLLFLKFAVFEKKNGSYIERTR